MPGKFSSATILPLLTLASHCSKSGRPQVIRLCLSCSRALGLIPPTPRQTLQASESQHCLFAFSSLDPCTVANRVYCSTAAFRPTKYGSIVSTNFPILFSLVSNALSLGVCTTETAPSNILLIRGNSGISSGSFLSLLSPCDMLQ